MNHNNTNEPNLRTGFTLVESLVAITILLVGLVGPMTIASRGLQSATFALEQNTAFFLAQEGIDSVVFYRNSNGVQYVTGNGGLGPRSDPLYWYKSIFESFDSCPDFGNCACDVTSVDDSGVCPFGIQLPGSAINCQAPASSDNCDLYYHAGGAISIFNHTAGGSVPTPYNRTLKLARNPATDEVHVVVTVSWDSPLFGTNRSVSLETRLFNLYD